MGFLEISQYRIVLLKNKEFIVNEFCFSLLESCDAKGMEGEEWNDNLSTLLCLRDFPVHPKWNKMEVDKHVASCDYGRDRSHGLDLLFYLSIYSGLLFFLSSLLFYDNRVSLHGPGCTETHYVAK